jgi:plasmid stabilization system protein ParE
MRFCVLFTAEAEEMARRIRDWIAERSPQGAVSWLDALDQAQALLAQTADQHEMVPESDVFDESLRQLLFKTRRGNRYRALYIIRDTTVYIVAIRGAGQEMISPDGIELPE